MINSIRPRCHKVVGVREKPGRPFLPGDPPRLCGRPLGHNPPCRWEKAVETYYRARWHRDESALPAPACLARPGYLPVTGVALLAHVAERNVRLAIHEGRLPSELADGRRWVPLADAERYRDRVAARRALTAAA